MARGEDRRVEQIDDSWNRAALKRWIIIIFCTPRK